MGKRTKSDIAREYVKKYFPKRGKKTIASMLMRDYPQDFYEIEQSRTVVRRVTQATGKRGKEELEAAGLSLEEQAYDSDLTLPQSLAEDNKFNDYVIPSDVKGMIVLPDLHIPYHNEAAITIALKYLDDHKRKIDAILLNGDFIDMYQLGFWSRDPLKFRFKGELEIAKDFLQLLRKRYPNQRIYYKEGNHEERLKRYLWTNAPEISDLDNLRFEELMELARFGVQYIGDKRTVKFANLNIIHGHEYRQSFFNPVNPARGLFLRAKTNALCGHYHRTSYHAEPNLNRHVTGTWSTGCLCSLFPDYDPNNKWNHGFADLRREGDRDFSVRNFQIINGRIV